ncbi:cytochrome c oxidase assembly protein subunit 15 [Leucobacter exalbidus]|uniref:Cytochrome c oxidase assembly protein subunit 15 n=1 Tax=Leucobacter exalbidus TaxID=662960 RepID=A0A940PLF5_9MICO|nr:COX15/CtaA family protein [Leucobacter exalbidus]MBP1325238.1 cytochrome c oxidase assembly protein subunit 15 [Leucobacter exalbidus]
MSRTSTGTATAKSTPTSSFVPSRWLRFSAWASFVLNTLIIATGGAVRLTGSGLGCPDWPLCAPGSLVPTDELSYHSLIEFGNRTISGPLLVFAILTLVLSWKVRGQRRDLSVLALIVFGLVALQAFVGGVIVWMHLNANLVAFHYVVSLGLVCLTAAFIARMNEAPGARERVVPKPFAIVTHVTTLAMALTVLVGVLTTASGPHSGDSTIQRDGIDAVLMSHIHSWPGYTALALTVVLLVWAVVQKLRPLPWLVALLAVLVVQILVGVYQARNGLPPLAVGVHMVLASLTAAAMTIAVLRLKRPVAQD